jgi:hypothetical protein
VPLDDLNLPPSLACHEGSMARPEIGGNDPHVGVAAAADVPKVVHQ